jgi:hypothetical protein
MAANRFLSFAVQRKRPDEESRAGGPIIIDKGDSVADATAWRDGRDMSIPGTTARRDH